MKRSLAVLLTTTVLIAGITSTVEAQPTVRIKPDYLRKWAEESMKLFEHTRGDSATMIFTRGTRRTMEDVAKLQKAGQREFVDVLLSVVAERNKLIVRRLQQRPLSTETRLGERLPELYGDLYERIVALRDRASRESSRWQRAVDSTRAVVNAIAEQLDRPGSSIASPDE